MGPGCGCLTHGLALNHGPLGPTHVSYCSLIDMGPSLQAYLHAPLGALGC
jgi:hypothetical protein